MMKPRLEMKVSELFAKFRDQKLGENFSSWLKQLTKLANVTGFACLIVFVTWSESASNAFASMQCHIHRQDDF